MLDGDPGSQEALAHPGTVKEPTYSVGRACVRPVRECVRVYLRVGLYLLRPYSCGHGYLYKGRACVVGCRVCCAGLLKDSM